MAIEFRSFRDDAWYDAHILKEPRQLRVKFVDFGDEHDEMVAVEGKPRKDVEAALRSRLRKVSVQVQDHEFANVQKGLVVCAIHFVPPEDRRYFDGIIHTVVRKEHRIEKGKEICSCKFVVEWTSGPDVGILSNLHVKDICRVQQAGKDDEELIRSLLDGTKDKNGRSFPILTNEKGRSDDQDSSRITKKLKTGSARLNKGTPAERYALSVMSRFGTAPRKESECIPKELQQKSKQAEMTEKPIRKSGGDNDIERVHHVLVVENLEKETSPVTIMQFLYQQLSLSSIAFVMPSKASQTYTSGIIMLDNEMNLEKVSNFLESPDRIIISSRGRPWIVSAEKHLCYDALSSKTQITIGHLSQATLQNKTSRRNELKVVNSGTPEYRKAKMLKKLIKEFINHQCELHKRLLHDEAKILKLPM